MSERTGDRFSLIVVFVLATLSIASFANDQSFQFRAAATRVIVDVLVLDSEGNPVPGLAVEDFELFEDGQLQRVESLEVVDWESHRPPIPTSDRTVATLPLPDREETRNAQETPRRFVIAINRSQAEASYLQRAKHRLGEFVSQYTVDRDEFMILDIGNTVQMMQDFRAGTEQALVALGRIQPIPFARAPLMPIEPGSVRASASPYGPARDAWSFLAELGERLEMFEGRKVVIFMSMDFDTLEASPRMRRAIQQLNQANATLYSLDLQGAFGSEQQILVASRNSVPADAYFGERQGQAVGGNFLPSPRESRGGTGALAAVSYGTGGIYYPNQISFLTALRAIGRENQLYYLLSFSPVRSELDGQYRELSVRIPDSDDLRVVARPGYYARSSRNTRSADLIRGDYGYLIPTALELHTYFLGREWGDVRCALLLALPQTYVEARSRARVRIMDADGQIAAERVEEIERGHFWMLVEVSLPEGDYQVEVAVDGPDAVRVTHSAILSVPGRYGWDYSLSGIFPYVTEAHEARLDGLPIRPVPLFESSKDAPVGFFIFPGDLDPVESVHFRYEIRNERGDTVRVGRGQAPFSLGQTVGHGDGLPVKLSLRTSGLQPGMYSAVVQAEEAGGSRTATGRLTLAIR